ncbi:hypothetical protein Micbo1qcDRAFT_181357 [Microdochium bolleyi]|uniref:Uncharacterized protein n=1 Tax=Microdochium bolleyi TaxID=196109 RepID=A0A136IJI0_9PEZI|nr:hypothetical protein Micbo1qcDRAFT_181357 [Microdochium bolleyi]
MQKAVTRQPQRYQLDFEYKVVALPTTQEPRPDWRQGRRDPTPLEAKFLAQGVLGRRFSPSMQELQRCGWESWAEYATTRIDLPILVGNTGRLDLVLSIRLTMQISLAVTVLALSPYVAAFGKRGAAERAMIYALYAMEDVYGDDESKWTIGKGCVGSRDNLVKTSTKMTANTKRCTLGELLDHMWHTTELQALVDHKQAWRPDTPQGQPKAPLETAQDEAPDRATATRRVDTVMNVINLERGSVQRITKNVMLINDPGSLIRDVPVKITAADGTTTTTNRPLYRPNRSYTGLLNVANVLEGATDYYDTISALGPKFKAAQAELRRLQDLDKPPAGQNPKPARDRWLPNGVNNIMDRWEEKFRTNVDYVYELRPDDDTPGRDTIKSKPHQFPGGGAGEYMEIKPYQEPSKELTIANWQADGFTNEAAASAKWDAAVASYSATRLGRDHDSAITAIRNTQRVSTPSTTVTPACGP